MPKPKEEVRLHGWRRYDYMEVIGTTPWMGEVELRREQQPRDESGTETEKMSGTYFPDRAEHILEQI